MADSEHTTGDRYSLERFVKAQQRSYEQAAIRNARKRLRWMWYILPQFSGLGFSSMSRYYTVSPNILDYKER